jgi:hypothetical protein
MDRSDLDSLSSAVASTCRSAADCAAESMQHPVQTSGDFLYLNTQEEHSAGEIGAGSTKTFSSRPLNFKARRSFGVIRGVTRALNGMRRQKIK